MVRARHCSRIQTSVAATLLLASSQLLANDATAAVVKFNIEPQPLAQALNSWADQAGLQIIWPVGDPAAYRNTPGVRGQLEPMQALQTLLGDTGLTYSLLSGGQTVAIHERGDSSQVPAALNRPPAVLAAQLDEAKQDGAAESRADAPAQGSASPSGKSSQSPASLQTLAEVIVTGTHFHDAPNNTVPVQVLDRKYIESTGISTTTGLMESLPQNFALANQSGVLVPGVSNPTVQGSAINLRGIGEGTTLTLLNGRRMALGFLGGAADISALPLSAIERVEILTDGASAIYGSDAVGGVVNFILRRDFEGAETSLRTGWADGGVNEYRASQAVGHAWASGNALVSVEYYKRDLLPASERDFIPDTSDIGSLGPRDKNVSVLFSGRQEMSDSLSVFADALYTKRESQNEGGRVTLRENFENDNPQMFGTVGLNWQLAGNWQAELSGTYARNKLDAVGSNNVGGGIFLHTDFEMREAQLMADGSLFELSGGAVRLALGADWRSEAYQESSEFEGGGTGIARDDDQIVRSVFAELSVPLIGSNNARTGARRLELSLAGRYDDYSVFGSSFDPRYGLMWEPVEGVRFRGSYGTSYVAPRLFDYSLSGEVGFAVTDLDPGSPSGFSRQLVSFGTDVAHLRAQKSESMSFGIEFIPTSLRELQVDLNYYQIKYHDRIAFPPFPSVILGNPASFGALITRNPSAQQVDELVALATQGQGFFDCDIGCVSDPNFDPASIEVIVDDRKRNLSETNTSGFDLSLDYELAAAGGRFQFGLGGTYILELEQKVSAEADAFDTAGTYSNPPDWRLRGSLGFERHGWATNLFVTHTDSYIDNRPITPVPVDSYTIVDIRLAYHFSARFQQGFASGLTVSAAVQNVLDQDPPRTAVLNFDSDMGFDPTNANPMGRFLSIEVQKVW